jgi:hypothetical protein
MAWEVNTTNRISEDILRGALDVGSLSWAAYALGSPLGALGGATYGVVYAVSHYSLSAIIEWALFAKDPRANTAVKTLHAAIPFFGGHAAAWAALTAAGFSFTVGSIIEMMVFSLITYLALALIISCFTPPNPSRV